MIFRNIFLAAIILPLMMQVACTADPAGTSSLPAGKVVRIVDGDTYDILLKGEQTRIRMYGIDAPERGMDYYNAAKAHLGKLCEGGMVYLQIIEKDRYNRIIAKSFLTDGRELGEQMVKEGLAWHFTKYSNDRNLARAEAAAKAAGIGIWSLASPIAPWDFRKSKRKR